MPSSSMPKFMFVRGVVVAVVVVVVVVDRSVCLKHEKVRCLQLAAFERSNFAAAKAQHRCYIRAPQFP